MKDSIHSYFRVGTLQFMSYPATASGEGDILSSLQKILEDPYFDAVEITRINDPLIRKKAKQMIEQAGVAVGFGAQPILLSGKLNVNALVEEERLCAQNALFEAIDQAEEMGAKSVGFVSGRYEEDTKQEAYRQLLKTTYSVCEYAKQKGISMELEVFDYDVDKKSLIGPSALAARFAGEIRQNYDNFGLLVDLSHIPLMHETNRYTIRMLAPFITHLHIGNAVMDNEKEAYGDNHPRFYFPNSANGVEELVDFLACLKREGLFIRNEPLLLSFEVKPWKDEDPGLVLASSKRVLNRAWALLNRNDL